MVSPGRVGGAPEAPVRRDAAGARTRDRHGAQRTAQRATQTPYGEVRPSLRQRARTVAVMVAPPISSTVPGGASAQARRRSSMSPEKSTTRCARLLAKRRRASVGDESSPAASQAPRRLAERICRRCRATSVRWLSSALGSLSDAGREATLSRGPGSSIAASAHARAKPARRSNDEETKMGSRPTRSGHAMRPYGSPRALRAMGAFCYAVVSRGCVARPRHTASRRARHSRSRSRW